MLPMLISDRLTVLALFASTRWTQYHSVTYMDFHRLLCRVSILRNAWYKRERGVSQNEIKKGEQEYQRPRQKRSRSREIKTAFNPLSISTSILSLFPFIFGVHYCMSISGYLPTHAHYCSKKRSHSKSIRPNVWNFLSFQHCSSNRWYPFPRQKRQKNVS